VGGGSAADGGALFVSAQSTVSLNHVDVIGGSATRGGAIFNQGALTGTDVVITSASASQLGGAVYNAGSLIIRTATISGNTASDGGAVQNVGMLDAANATLYENRASASGGAMHLGGGAATLVNDALRDGSPDERRRIGTALADSGLLYEAIEDLKAENYESCYGAFSLLFLVAKAGVVEPLISVIENNPSTDLSLALLRLLASSHEPEVISAFSRLADNASLTPEVRRVAVESLAQLNAQPSAA
jgi:hypothetical protein